MNHLKQLLTGLLPCSFLLIKLGVHSVKLSLDIFRKLGCAFFTFATLGFDVLLEIEYPLLHLFGDHVNGLALLVGDLLKRVTDLNKFLVRLLDPGLHLVISLRLLLLNLIHNVILQLLDLPLES